MMQYVAFAVVITLLLPLAWWMRPWRNARLRRLAAALPGPPPLPLIGSGLLFVNTSRGFLDVITQLMQQYGEHVCFYLGTELNVIISNPHDIRLLLMSNKLNQKGPLYKAIEDVIGPGMLTGGPTWRSHRKIVTPAYNKRSVQQFSEVFNQEAGNLIQELSRRSPDDTFNIFHDIVRTTTQCVCQTLMGLTKEESLRVDRLDEVVALTDDMYTLFFNKMTKWYWWWPFFTLLGGKRQQDKYKEAVFHMTKDIIRMRTESLKDNNVAENDLAGDKVFGVIDRFILSKELTENEVIEESFSLFTTSQEASAKIASCVLLFLAHLPEWQEKVWNEIVDVMGTEERPVCHEDFKRLPALDLVYREALRYQPIGACIQRTVVEDITLDKVPVTLPAGTPVVFPIHALHRDPRYWRHPDRVMPERFLAEESRYRDPNAFIPFSLGPMDCLGRVYATAVIKTLVVSVVRRYRLHAVGSLEDLELDIAVSAKMKAGYHLRVSSRP